MNTALFWCAYAATNHALLICCGTVSVSGQDGGYKQHGQTATIWLKTRIIWLAMCSHDFHWHWINWTLLCDTMEVSMLRLAWLTIAQHEFQPALPGRLELISRKMVSCDREIRLSRWAHFAKKLSPANWVQGVIVISRNISRSLAPKNGVQHGTALYSIPRYTRPWYIGSTLYLFDNESFLIINSVFSHTTPIYGLGQDSYCTGDTAVLH